jgi:hypothetical protein
MFFNPASLFLASPGSLYTGSALPRSLRTSHTSPFLSPASSSSRSTVPGSSDNGEDRSTGRYIMRERQLIRSNSAVQLAQCNLRSGYDDHHNRERAQVALLKSVIEEPPGAACKVSGRKKLEQEIGSFVLLSITHSLRRPITEHLVARRRKARRNRIATLMIPPHIGSWSESAGWS